ncbi:thiosulfate/3-mercaptopyruvate sulfurtransferase [Microbacterium sp. SLBN-154]|uniref:sulfurtransferase n=1 Tax=Microbacterium sp. SLBN-154 TaxID=2768458 RepID=UPI0011521B3D|nr:sulfurtransferase [Microbacterium sp. SLBN-154]TQK17624.1 thiosulfate/3-mercaptopyruvate sulfurtransferase [Microbacterium sp. SLBN-154]
MPLLITPHELVSELKAGRSVRLLDVRWRLNLPEGRPGYVSGHLPGAVYVDLEQELADPGHPEIGRYPLPRHADLQNSARRWGIRDGDLVVAYDDNDAVSAARAWWLLRHRGLDVRVLDGGIRAWVAAGLLVERGDVLPPRGDIDLPDLDPGVATIEDAARAPGTGYLVDVRSPEHYRGQSSRIDEAGHIPGAVNIPTVSHIAPDGTLRTAEQIRATVAAASIDPTAEITLYCGTGIASAHSALALARAGIDTRIYVGSWSQWTLSSDRPIAVGPTPSATLRGW